MNDLLPAPPGYVAEYTHEGGGLWRVPVVAFDSDYTWVADEKGGLSRADLGRLSRDGWQFIGVFYKGELQVIPAEPGRWVVHYDRGGPVYEHPVVAWSISPSPEGFVEHYEYRPITLCPNLEAGEPSLERIDWEDADGISIREVKS